MKKITLERLIYKNYLKTSFTSILFIELVLVIIYFTVNYNMIQKNIDLMLKDTKFNAHELVNEKVKAIDDKIAEIETLSKTLQKEYQSFSEQSLENNINKKPYDFIEDFLNINLPYNGKSFVLNNDGKIVAMSKETEKILDIKESFDFKNIIENKDYSEKINLNGYDYLLFVNKIEKTPFFSISLIKEEDILKDIRELEKYYKKVGYLIILSIFIFYAIFFMFLHLKARSFVSKINTPLLKIMNITKDIGKNKNIKNLEPCGIYEIDKLSSNFNNLVKELDIRTNNLIIEETKRIYHEKLANTDSLTGAYNRRYLNEFSITYLKINQREKSDLSLLMIDLDDFKIINDTYGHKVGDEVIQSLVNISKILLRENDLIIRFGGDEFLILLPNTNIENAKLVALKLIDSISIYNKNKEISFTVSIGSSQFNENDKSIENMIKRADESLYEAKKMGKNCIF